MSVHKSLVVNTALSRARNVFTRAERLEKLAETSRWKEGDTIFGLPKVKTRAKVKKVKKEKKAEATAEGAVPAEGAEAAPAAGAAGSKPGASKPAAAKPAAAAKSAEKGARK